MKKVKFLIVFLILTLAFQMSNAGNTDTKTDSDRHSFSETTLRINTSNKNHRPNAPSRSYIECFYGEGFVQFVFPDGVQTMMVRVYNVVEEYVGTVTADTPWIELPKLSGIYDIDCTTDDGRVFSGSVEW